jgi:hypothetical protein
MQFLWCDTIDMQGGRIIGEGVDGCIFEGPMWPCAAGSSGSQAAPNTKDTRYVSKLVSKRDEETFFLRMAERLLGKNLAERYISRLQTECEPATQQKPPAQKNLEIMIQSEKNVKAWPNKGEEQACGELKRKLESKINISKDSKLMIISKYSDTVRSFVDKMQDKSIPYRTILQNVENAIPKFIFILQKLFQNPSEQLIHIDLHTGNIIVRYNPFEFGIADFGHCVFRRANEDPSNTLFGGFLLTYVSRVGFSAGFNQVPLEARLLSFCYMKNLDNVSPAVLVKTWENDTEVREYSEESTDVIVSERSRILSGLLQRRLFIAMIESIQSICKKIRGNLNNPSGLYSSLSSTEKIVVEFILTRYAILSPINTINAEIMNIYPYELYKQGNNLIRFITKGIMAPYLQDGSSLDKALSSVQGADLGILWSDIVSGKTK